MEDGGGERVFEHDRRARHASVRLTVGARPERMLTEHHLRMLGEIAVHPDRALVLGRAMDFGEIEPGVVAGSIAIAALPEEEDVDANVGAGVGAEAAFGQPDGGDEIGRAGDVLARATRPPCPSCRAMSRKPPDRPGFSRSIALTMK